MRSCTLSGSVEGRGMSAGSACRLGPREISCLDSEMENLLSAMVPLSWGQTKKKGKCQLAFRSPLCARGLVAVYGFVLTVTVWEGSPIPKLKSDSAKPMAPCLWALVMSSKLRWSLLLLLGVGTWLRRRNRRHPSWLWIWVQLDHHDLELTSQNTPSSCHLLMSGLTIQANENQPFSLKNIYLFICFYFYFLAVLCPSCCAGFFSSCSERALFSSCGALASPCSGFSCRGAQALGYKG